MNKNEACDEGKQLFVGELPDDIRDAVKRCINAEGLAYTAANGRELVAAHKALDALGWTISSFGGPGVDFLLQSRDDSIEPIFIKNPVDHDAALIVLAKAKAQGFIDKLLAETAGKNLRDQYPVDVKQVIKVFLSVADERGVAAVRLAMPFAVISGKAVFDHVLPKLRGEVPDRAPAISAAAAQAVNEGGVDVIVQSVGEYEVFYRPLTRTDFAWVTDECVIPEDDRAAVAA